MYVRVRAVPEAKKEMVLEMGERELVIHVRESVQQNCANTRIIEILSEHFSIPGRAIQMLSGFHSPHKVFTIHEHHI